jgi:hypothetical protein
MEFKPIENKVLIEQKLDYFVIEGIFMEAIILDEYLSADT